MKSRWRSARSVDFPNHAETRTKQLRLALEANAAKKGQPVEYLQGFTSKEALVQQRRQHGDVAPDGLICAFSTLESCSSYDIFRNAKTHQIQLRRRPRK